MTKRFRTAAALLALLATTLMAGCYPRYDWRDYRPDCSHGWCGFVASFPGRVTRASREIPMGTTRLPLTLDVVSVGDVKFAIGAFDLRAGGDPAEARATFERKLLDDVGATQARRTSIVLHAADHGEIPAEAFEADGSRDGGTLRVSARFAERRGRLVEILVIGPGDVLSTASGRQAVETFLTSLRLD